MHPMATYKNSFLQIILVTFFVAQLIICEARVPNPTNNAPGFVRVQGSRFALNASPFLFNGFNSYWLMHVAAEPSERYKVSQVFRDASAAGLSVCRTWAFSDGGSQPLQISPGIYDERVFQGLDFVISEAKKYDIRLILSFVNNYNDFGGRHQYVEWGKNAGTQLTGDDDFYTHPVIKQYYKNHIKRVLTRFNTFTRSTYMNDPTVMSWELINEPRCKVDYSGKTVNGWVQEMASYVKSLDSRHLLEIGMEGFYGDTVPEKKQYNPGYEVGTDFISNNMIKEIDFTTIHAYPDQWLSGKDDDAQMIFMQRWMSSHWQDSKDIVKKPFVIAEFGKSSKNPGFNLKARNEYMGNVFRLVYGFAKRGGTMGGSLVWQLTAQGMEPYDDGYAIVLGQSPSTVGLLSAQAHAMTALAHSLNDFDEGTQPQEFAHSSLAQQHGRMSLP